MTILTASVYKCQDNGCIIYVGKKTAMVSSFNSVAPSSPTHKMNKSLSDEPESGQSLYACMDFLTRWVTDSNCEQKLTLFDVIDKNWIYYHF